MSGLLAELVDLEARLGGPLAGAEVVRALGVLEDASALVREEAGRTWLDETGNTVGAPESIRAVVLRAAERAMRNPGGFSAESAGDYSYQRTGVEPGVYLTAGELRIVHRAARRSGLWTQATTRGEDEWNTGWVDDQFGLEPFPLDVLHDQP